MSLVDAKKMMATCCPDCRENAILGCLTERQAGIYNAVKVGGGGRTVSEISLKAQINKDNVAVELLRMLEVGLLERQKTELDARYSFYSVPVLDAPEATNEQS